MSENPSEANDIFLAAAFEYLECLGVAEEHWMELSKPSGWFRAPGIRDNLEELHRKIMALKAVGLLH